MSALSLGEVISQFPREVLDRYDFTRARYTGALEPITGIRCREHGEFQQYAGQLRKNGAGCPKCGVASSAGNRRLNPSDVVAKCKVKHNGYYTYERAAYVNGRTKFMVTCPVHGDFEITPMNHLYQGRGCPACGAIKRGYKTGGKAS